MDFTYEDDTMVREKIRSFLAATLPESMRGGTFEWRFDSDFHQAFVAWQHENLLDASDATMDAFADELLRADLELRTIGPTALVAQILSVLGTPEQRAEYIPRFLRGEALCALGYTEPDSGSDVASAATRAIRDGDEWVISGEKMFTSNAAISDYVFLLTRTNTEVPKHQGLTTFLVPLTAPGVEIRPIDTLRGHPTYMTYYDDVRVPDSCRVGDVDAGWSVMRVALDVEHGAGKRITLDAGDDAARSYRLESRLGHAGGHGVKIGHTLTRLVEWARGARDHEGRRVIDDPFVRSTLAGIAIDLEVIRLLQGRNDPEAAKPGVGNGKKLFGSEAYQRATQRMLEIAGPAGIVDYRSEGSVADGWVEYTFRDATVATISGGSSEVQRDIIAERRLGLPTARRAARANTSDSRPVAAPGSV
ncbi:acyl-CoA dehydrogenase family protein [Microbacterium sp. X-17]|uniref:acyl-CoA dehydrogenase family protein n=1 Tax=Microbacterium sp. X-17 TaxID=3144404 RepID=UPI0031F53122